MPRGVRNSTPLPKLPVSLSLIVTGKTGQMELDAEMVEASGLKELFAEMLDTAGKYGAIPAFKTVEVSGYMDTSKTDGRSNKTVERRYTITVSVGPVPEPEKDGENVTPPVNEENTEVKPNEEGQQEQEEETPPVVTEEPNSEGEEETPAVKRGRPRKAPLEDSDEI